MHYNTHMLKQTNLLAGNFETLEDAQLAATMLETFAVMHGTAIPKFDLKKVGENFYRLTQKSVKLPK